MKEILKEWREYQREILSEAPWGDAAKHRGHPAIDITELQELVKTGQEIPTKYLRQILSRPTHPGRQAANGKLSIAAMPQSRQIINVDVGGTVQAFYRSSGTGHLPKEVYLDWSPDQIRGHEQYGQRTGRWNPFSGIGGELEKGRWTSGWFNKDIYDDYNRTVKLGPGGGPGKDVFTSSARHGSVWLHDISDKLLNKLDSPLQWSVRAVRPDKVNTEFINNPYSRSLDKQYQKIKAAGLPGSEHASQVTRMDYIGDQTDRFNQRMEMEGQLPKPKPRGGGQAAGREAAETAAQRVAGGAPESNWRKYAKKLKSLGKAAPVVGAALTAFDIDNEVKAAIKNYSSAETPEAKLQAVTKPIANLLGYDAVEQIKSLPDAIEVWEQELGESPFMKTQTPMAKAAQERSDQEAGWEIARELSKKP
tara:strand:- start:690 stop:1949 length:1260 start_codon:yes stop_codon:yes gene_type:complete